jgi:secondary thiamine-phosphate synthase enzyme
MGMNSGRFSVATGSRMEFVDITSRVQKEISQTGISDGICYIYNPHTTAGLTINEGADPAVQDDIVAVLKKIIPFDHPYRHLEGNSPAHIMASLMGSSVTDFIPVRKFSSASLTAPVPDRLYGSCNKKPLPADR